MSLSSTSTSVTGTNNVPNPVFVIPATPAGGQTVNITNYASGTIFQIGGVAAAGTLSFPLPAPTNYAGSSWRLIVGVAPSAATSLITLGTAGGANIFASLTAPTSTYLAISSIVTFGVTGTATYALGDYFDVSSTGLYWVAKFVSTVNQAGLIVRTA
jgi:hypothetical protein